MRKAKAIWPVALLCLALRIEAQDEIQQFPWQERDRKDIKPLEFQYQREADVMWSKLIWRVIDTRQKMNLPFAWPVAPLIKIIHEAVLRGEVTAYDASSENADQFKKVLSIEDAKRIGVRSDTSIQVNVLNPEIEDTVYINEPLRWDHVSKYRIKEVWFFDTNTSTMQVRIIGIAPVIEDYDEKGNYRGDMTMYWLPFDSLRLLLTKYEPFNPQNDGPRMSWDDLLTMRMFESTIYKESNVYDRNIQEYATGTEALLESDRIKQELFEKEHDLWEY